MLTWNLIREQLQMKDLTQPKAAIFSNGDDVIKFNLEASPVKE